MDEKTMYELRERYMQREAIRASKRKRKAVRKPMETAASFFACCCDAVLVLFVCCINAVLELPQRLEWIIYNIKKPKTVRDMLESWKCGDITALWLDNWWQISGFENVFNEAIEKETDNPEEIHAIWLEIIECETPEQAMEKLNMCYPNAAKEIDAKLIKCVKAAYEELNETVYLDESGMGDYLQVSNG